MDKWSGVMENPFVCLKINSIRNKISGKKSNEVSGGRHVVMYDGKKLLRGGLAGRRPPSGPEDECVYVLFPVFPERNPLNSARYLANDSIYWERVPAQWDLSPSKLAVNEFFAGSFIKPGFYSLYSPHFTSH